ncbi:MAG: hypothetical protein ACK5LL_15205 [Suipraeoptans sp.]
MKTIKRIGALVLSLMLILGLVLPSVENADAAEMLETPATITSTLSSDYNSYVFTVEIKNASLDYYYQLYDDSGLVVNTTKLPADGIVEINDVGNDYTIIVFAEDPLDEDAFYSELQARSEVSHPYSVYYSYDNGNGKIKEKFDGGVVYIGDRLLWEADYEISRDGKIYEIDGADSTYIEFGTSEVVFNYKPYDPESVEAVITYVDTSGKVIGDGQKETLEYYGGDVTLTLPQTLEIEDNGVKYTYNKVTRTDEIILNYSSSKINYEIEYRLEEEEQTGPFTVYVSYIEEGSNATLSSLKYTIDPLNPSTHIIPTQPASFESLRNGIYSYYEVVDASSLDITVTDFNVIDYNIVYKKVASDEPYTWTVTMMDATGERPIAIKTARYTVKPDMTPVRHTVESIIQDENGNNYVLTKGYEKEYTHTYGDDEKQGRTLIVYYNPVGRDAELEYEVTVQYRNVTTDEVFNEKTVMASAGETLEIDLPAEIETEDTTLVKLSGQGDINNENVVSHSYYSPRRNYILYYRDINDIQNLDSVVYTINPIDVVNETIVGEDNPNADILTALQVTSGAAGETLTVVSNETTGETTTYTEEGVPLADSIDQDDEEVPQAKGQTASVTSSTPFVVGGIIAGLLILGLILLFLKKRRQATVVNDTDDINI